MFLITSFSAAWAATWSVSTEQELFQACRDAVSGDLIEVEPGSRYEVDCSPGADIVLRSSEAGSYAEIRGVVLNAAASGSHLEDLLLGSGSGAVEALLLFEAQGVTASNIQVVGGDAYGVTSYGGSLEIDGLSSTEPFGDQFAAIYVASGAGAAASPTELVLKNCSLESTGIVVFLLDDEGATNHVAFEDCSIHSGGWESNWGGLVQSLGNTDASFTRVDLVGGAATGETNYPGEGGAVLVPSGTEYVFEDCHFEDNLAHFGGALAVEGQATVTNSTFLANRGHGGAAIKVMPGGSLELEDSWILNNQAFSLGGDHDLHDWPIVPGVYSHDAELRVRRSVFCANSSLESGETTTASAVQVDGGTAQLSRLVLHANDANTWGSTLGFYGAVAELEHLSVLHNRQSSIWATESDVSLANSVFDGDNGGLENPFGGRGYNAWVGGLGENAGPDDFVVNEPGFAGFEPGDCESLPYLAEGSSLIDAGHPDSLDEDGSVADVGALPYGADWGSPGDEEDEVRTWFSGGCGGAQAGALLLLPLLLTRRRR